jgi:hypothetical protein
LDTAENSPTQASSGDANDDADAAQDDDEPMAGPITIAMDLSDPEDAPPHNSTPT